MKTRSLSIACIAALLSLGACGGTDEPGEFENEFEASEEVVGDPEVGTTEQGISGITSRADYVASVATNPGSWGNWTATRFCPAGSFATKYRMRVQSTRGTGDDSALNA